MTARIGRPLKPVAPGTRVSLGLRVTAETKGRLEAAAKRSGRTQSQEADFRLARSFDVDAVLRLTPAGLARLRKAAT